MTENNSGDRWAAPKMQARLRRRQQTERLFRWLGALAIAIALGSLALLLVSIGSKGAGAFRATEILLDIEFDTAELQLLHSPTAIDEAKRENELASLDTRKLTRNALRRLFPDVQSRGDKRMLGRFLSRGAGSALQEAIEKDPSLATSPLAIWLPADDELDLFRKNGPEGSARYDETQIAWAQSLTEQGRLRSVFNWRFLSSGDSREPELAGIFGALVGSFLTLSITLALILPLGVATAVYLEEFAPKGRFTEFVEVNINNLAAVPSIVFGLLGLALFLGVAHLPRSAPLVGGLTLSLMTFSTIIITGRVSIQAVPPSIREAALGVGASPIQVVTHHVLPLAMPGILTGTIIGMARALGETAPLLMIGMVAFVVDIPTSVSDASTALPVQIFLWSGSPERAFIEKTSGAILVLLAFLIGMNGTAIGLRRHFEKKW
jgi:phosphate transport system permease protein